MEVLSHRGYWKTPQEKNQRVAFERSFDLGFGTETDVRDHCGRLVIAHDMPTGDEMSLADMLDILGERDLPLALNIKADGLGPALQAEMVRRPHLTRWFTFDMSGPELIRQHRDGLPAFTRLSDHEPFPILGDQVRGVWLDAFDGDWFAPADIRAILDRGQTVCLVSPELHGREPDGVWDRLAKAGLHDTSLMVCTDRPEDLRAQLETTQR